MTFGSRCAGVLLGLSLFLLGSPAAAQLANSHPGLWPSGAFNASLSFGDRLTFGLGVDVRMLYVFGPEDWCRPSSTPRTGVGGFAQATWLVPRSARFAGGLTAGAEASRGNILPLMGEAGYSYRLALDEDHRGGHALHVGFLAVPIVVDLSLRGSIPLSGQKPELTVGLGVRAPTMLGGLGCPT